MSNEVRRKNWRISIRLQDRGMMTLEGYGCCIRADKTHATVYIPEGKDTSLAQAELLMRANRVTVIPLVPGYHPKGFL